jgi:transcriptional regulator with XRE-family HTH domain
VPIRGNVQTKSELETLDHVLPFSAHHSMRWEAIVGRNVRSPRKARGFTQEALAHAAEIDTRYVGGIERGEENPTVAVLARIASVLGIEPGAFFAKPSLPLEKTRARTGGGLANPEVPAKASPTRTATRFCERGNPTD